MNFYNLPVYLLDGICIGAIYALIALGYTMVYGIIKLINFAHGEFFMVSAYAGLGIFTLISERVPLIISIPVTILGSGIAGAAIAVIAEQIAYKPIRNADRLIALLTAIGVSFLLQNLFTFVNGGNALSFHGISEIIDHSFPLYGTHTFQTIKILYVILSLLLMVLLWYITMHTRMGRAMRATSQDIDAARLMGINVDRVIMVTFAIGGFFAGIAGILIGSKNTIEPFMGFIPGLIAFVAAVIGGIGSIPGAVLGGFLIGIIQQLILWVGIPSGYRDVVTFLLLIVVLVIRPQGILGTVQNEKV
ncbi:MAG: branched-chain amino acid ABC transporter permease [Lentisphaeria bacterium]|nr:branched-chain amino acid ABC transporter permease [Lentisphaeria bacterium]NQZ67251.1 branched-chain amino acid ABC transporter permease [Lentisphaeria bacterium]